ncbi:hypothetical protein D9M70_270550 [compost metagenome]
MAQAQQVAEESLHVHRRQVVVGGIDPRLGDPDEQQAPDAHELENGQHHRHFAQLALARNARGEVDAGHAVEQEGHQVERHAEVPAAVVAGILRLAETGVVEGEHHQHPHAHVGGEAIPPTAGRRRGGAEVQPLRLVAVLADGQRHGGQQAEQIEGQQHAVELVQPVLHAAEDQRHAVQHHQQCRHGVGNRGIEMVERHGDHRALEDRVVDRRGEEDQRRQRGA